jgi:hypothetical protein
MEEEQKRGLEADAKDTKYRMLNRSLFGRTAYWQMLLWKKVRHFGGSSRFPLKSEQASNTFAGGEAEEYSGTRRIKPGNYWQEVANGRWKLSNLSHRY